MKFEDAVKSAVKYFGARGKFVKEASVEDPEMVYYREDLMNMNKLGFLTENSQGGNQVRGYSKETKTEYRIEERSYVSGFMKKDLLEKFLHQIHKNTDKIVIVPAVCVNNPGPDLFKFAIPVTIRSRKGPGIKDDKSTFSKITLDIPREQVELFAKQLKLDKTELKKCLYITCIDPMWNRQANLFEDIVESLKAAKRKK